MITNDLDKVREGDEIVIVKSARKPGTVERMRVVKAARVWLTVANGRGYEERYRRDDRSDGSGYMQHGVAYTVEEWERSQRSSLASKFLREVYGLDVRTNSLWSGKEHELAERIDPQQWNDYLEANRK